MLKVYNETKSKRAARKEREKTEFPNDPPRDALDEEADINVQKMLAGIFPTEHLTSNIGKEKDNGNLEYKLTLFERDSARIKHLVTQMNYRLYEGKGQAIYKLGVEDNGNPVGLTEEHLKGSLGTVNKKL